jgi:hypothetical protein
MLLNKKQIQETFDYETKIVKGVWGGEVKVRSMTVTQLFKFNELISEAKKTGNYSECYIWVCIWCIVDELDVPLFSDADYDAFAKKSHKSLAKIFSVVVSMNTISDASVEEVKKSLNPTT